MRDSETSRLCSEIIFVPRVSARSFPSAMKPIIRKIFPVKVEIKRKRKCKRRDNVIHRCTKHELRFLSTTQSFS